jgi:hypothetical protein
MLMLMGSERKTKMNLRRHMNLHYYTAEVVTHVALH